MSTEIEQLFGGANAEEQNALLHVIKARGYDFLEKTPVTTMTVRLLEDLHKLGYKLVKNNELLHDVSCSDINCKYEDRGKYLWCEKHGTAHKKRHCN